MYRIICDGKEIVRQGIDRMSAISGNLVQKLNTADQFTFTLPATHPYLSNAQPRSSIIELWRDNQCIFTGDVLQVSSDFYNNVTFTCQGVLAWLNDCVIPWPSFSGSASEYLERIINKYNGDVAANRQIVFGESDITTNISISYPEEMHTAFELTSEILSAAGGYLFLRYDGVSIYLDYLTDKGRTSGQKIRFGDNITDLENLIDTASFVTRVYPFGAEGLDIRSVNDGLYYVSDPALEATYGVVAATIQYNDVDNANTLKSLATAFLGKQGKISQTITLSAFDRSATDPRVDRIDIGDNVVVESSVHGIDATMICAEKAVDIVSGANDAITLGSIKKQISNMVGGNT